MARCRAADTRPHGVYAIGHLPTNPLDRAHAALLAGGERSALAGESAFVLWDVWKNWPAEPELACAEPRRRAGLRIHHCSTLLRRDVTIVDGLRVTSTARTLLDMAPGISEQQLTRAANDLRLRHLLNLRLTYEETTRYARETAARLAALFGAVAAA